ncbi:MAG: hypothetical protein ACLQFF_06605 [Steroidobacteraceae bacterium]|jgi:hypothetical protein
MNKLALFSALMLLGCQLACQAQTDSRNADQQRSTITSARSSADGSASGVNGSFGVSVRGNGFVGTADGSTVQIIGANISGLETGTASRWPQFAVAGPAFWSKVGNWGGQPLSAERSRPPWYHSTAP